MLNRKSNRNSKKPERFQDEKFIPGSGIRGCDQFDRGFDNHYNKDLSWSEKVDQNYFNRNYYKKDWSESLIEFDKCWKNQGRNLPSHVIELIGSFLNLEYYDKIKGVLESDIDFIADDSDEIQIENSDLESEIFESDEDSSSDEECNSYDDNLSDSD